MWHRRRKKNNTKLVDILFPSNTQGQRTHSARTNYVIKVTLWNEILNLFLGVILIFHYWQLHELFLTGLPTVRSLDWATLTCPLVLGGHWGKTFKILMLKMLKKNSLKLSLCQYWGGARHSTLFKVRMVKFK